MADEQTIMERNTVVISANPKSGSSSGIERAKQLQKRMSILGFECVLSTDIDQVIQMSSSLEQTGRLRTVVSAGGDGTAALLVSRLPRSIPLTLFPLGSENLLAKYFGLTCDVEATALAIEAMRTIALDVYDANGKICLLMASVGFDADVVHHVHRNRESHVTRWKYWKSIMWSLSSYRWPSLHIELLDAEGRTIESFDGDWLFAFNVPRYAANLQILECAQIDDGLLEVCGFRGSGLWTGLQHYWSVRSGGHEQLSTWFRKRASGARISEANSDRSINHAGGASFQLDGDWGGELPLEIRFTGERATLVVPPKSDD